MMNPEQAQAIACLGVHGLGFICVPGTARYIDNARLRGIIAQLPPFVERVGVFADAAVETIYETVIATGLSAIQLHGKESPEFCAKLAQRLPGMVLIKAIRVRDPEDLAHIQQYVGVVQAVLLDAYHPDQLGGTGRTIAWEWLKDFRPGLPWILAGGLKPENLSEALTMTQPDAVDLSSGVENRPGDKDLGRVAQVMRILQDHERNQARTP
jgi:phosphoribosylanthranilate isomerase